MNLRRDRSESRWHHIRPIRFVSLHSWQREVQRNEGQHQEDVSGVLNGASLETSASIDQEEASEDLVVLDSCHSTWYFDQRRMRFRRILKGFDGTAKGAATNWNPYFGLEVEDSSGYFVVHLNPSGTQLLRSWRHDEHCRQCSDQPTREIALADVQRLASA
jgi:hypothetical protein